jgi:hypothetical protein
MQQRQLESLVSAATGQPIPGTTPADPSGYGSVHIARVTGTGILGCMACWRRPRRRLMCRCLLRARGHAARLTLISQSMNVASIVSRRVELSGPGDLIKPAIIAKNSS